MRIAFTIALRNIFKHARKSLIVGAILFLGAFIMTTSSGVVRGMRKGLTASVVDAFTGNIVLVSTNQSSKEVLSTMFWSAKKVVPMNDFDKTKNALDADEKIASYLPTCFGLVLIFNDAGSMVPTHALGVDFPRYQRMFNSNVRIIEGAPLQSGEAGVLITGETRKFCYDRGGFWPIASNEGFIVSNFKDLVITGDDLQFRTFTRKREKETRYDNTPAMDVIREGLALVDEKRYDEAVALWKTISKDDPLYEEAQDLVRYTDVAYYIPRLHTTNTLVFLGRGNDFSTDVRVPITGMIRYNRFDTHWGAFNLMDIDSLRKCMGYVVHDTSAPAVTKSEQMFLTESEEDLEALFGMEEALEGGDEVIEEKVPKEADAVTPSKFGTYNMVLVKLQKGVSTSGYAKRLTARFAREGIDAYALTWEQALGQTAMYTTIFRGVLFGFVAFIFFVAAVIITNTLSMTVFERSTEIGMMRAVGAQKSFIGSMILWESSTLATVFGGCGIIFGGIFVRLLRTLNIDAGGSQVMELFYGGQTFAPYLGAEGVLFCALALIVVAYIAVRYPVHVARGLTAKEAVARE